MENEIKTHPVFAGDKPADGQHGDGQHGGRNHRRRHSGNHGDRRPRPEGDERNASLAERSDRAEAPAPAERPAGQQNRPDQNAAPAAQNDPGDAAASGKQNNPNNRPNRSGNQNFQNIQIDNGRNRYNGRNSSRSSRHRRGKGDRRMNERGPVDPYGDPEELAELAELRSMIVVKPAEPSVRPAPAPASAPAGSSFAASGSAVSLASGKKKAPAGNFSRNASDSAPAFASDPFSPSAPDVKASRNDGTADSRLEDGGEPFGGIPDSDLLSMAPETPSPLPAKPEEQVEVLGIRFRASGKTYYFDPHGVRASVGQHVIVDTARGPEFGDVVLGNKKVNVRDTVQPLRPVIRLATDNDVRRNEGNREAEANAMRVCAEKIAAHGLDMKLIEAQYTFDNSKLLFYFTSEGRVDFRDLVKDLASVFHTRIELRQIGIRDEAKMLGGLGVCGRSLCCSTFLPDFAQVSIKMAKEQNLSLNSSKISGVCGRLMCCLRFESETYAEEIRLTPAVDSLVRTPDGNGVVIGNSPLAGTVRVMLQDGQENAPKTFSRDEVTVLGKAKRGEIRQAKEAPAEAASKDGKKANGKKVEPAARASHASQKPAPRSENAPQSRSGDASES